jgi:hypothetical protein
MRIMTDLDVQGAAAKADNMVNPAFLAASMIDERAPDIVEALNDMPPELAVAVLLHLPPDRAIEVLCTCRFQAALFSLVIREEVNQPQLARRDSQHLCKLSFFATFKTLTPRR